MALQSFYSEQGQQVIEDNEGPSEHLDKVRAGILKHIRDRGRSGVGPWLQSFGLPGFPVIPPNYSESETGSV